MSNFYLNKYGFIPHQIKESPSSELGIIVVIPCYNEPDIITTLSALANCDLPQSKVEVILVVNSSEVESEEIRNKNLQSIQDFDCWKNTYQGEIDFYLIHVPDLPKKHAGVGLARKIGMDEAVHRFHEIDKDGIIVCFDADAECTSNYLVEIERHFYLFPKSPGCSIHYEHPIEGEEFNAEIYRGIINYELHLRYYNQCLRYCNLPYAFHTVGSSMAVRSSAYQKQGGMNKRKAGEDFYFIHKIIALGDFTEMKSAAVIPSPRISDRVPFGTGKAIGDWVATGDQHYLTYRFEIFQELRKITDQVHLLYENDLDITALHPSAIGFIQEINMLDAIVEIRANTKDESSFNKRFYAWFDAFKILKFVHYLRDNDFSNEDIVVSVKKLIETKSLKIAEDSAKNLLIAFRLLEKN